MTPLIADLKTAPEGTRALSDRVLLAMGWNVAGRGSISEVWTGPHGMWIDHHRPDPACSMDDLSHITPRGWQLATVSRFNTKGSKLPYKEGFAVQLLCQGGAIPIVRGEHKSDLLLAYNIAILKAKETEQ